MHTNIKFVKPCKHEHFFCLKTDNSILNLVPIFLLKTYCTWKTHNQGNQGNFKNPNWEIPYQIIQKKSRSILSPSKFLLLWTLVRYTKIREKSKISGPGPYFFSCSELGPWNKIWLPRCGNGDCPMLADFNFWEYLPSNHRS